MNYGKEGLVERLREQAQAPGHVWVDVMALLLEAATEINRLGAMYMQVGNELDDFKISLRDQTHRAAICELDGCCMLRDKPLPQSSPSSK